MVMLKPISELQAVFSHLIKRIKEIGNRHFTIMMIPHSEKQIFTFQISNFIIIFIILVIVFSGLSIILYSFQERKLINEIDTITRLAADFTLKKNKYDDALNTSFDIFDGYEQELKKIFSVLNIKNRKRIWKGIDDYNSIKEKLNKEYAITDQELPENIYKLHLLKEQIKFTSKHLKDIKTIFKTRLELLEYIPSKWPIIDGYGNKTSPFGIRISPFLGKKTFHTGVDIAWYEGTPVVAAANGTVIQVKYKSGYGNTVMIRHKYGYQTLYAHNNRIIVKEGQKVERGQRIALLGKTGRTTGPHVHFEVRVHGIPVDPWPYINTKF